MEIGQKKPRPWGNPYVTGLCLVLLAAIAVIASTQASPDDLPESLRLDSGWIFHFVFGLIAFLVIYVFAAVITFTITSGAPLTKIGFANFSFEGPAADTFVNGAASIRRIDEELGSLNETTQSLVSLAAESEAALAKVAEHPDIDQTIVSECHQRIRRLNRLSTTSGVSRQKTSESVRRFEKSFAVLQQVIDESEEANG